MARVIRLVTRCSIKTSGVMVELIGALDVPLTYRISRSQSPLRRSPGAGESTAFSAIDWPLTVGSLSSLLNTKED